MPTTFPPVAEQLAIIKRGVVDLQVESELIAKLTRSRETSTPLRIKLGADPSAPDLHLGHTVVLHKLRQFQDLGHHVLFLIGDFTAQIGDPTGKNETRPALTLEEIATNAESYQEQVFKILDPERTEIVFNSTWMNAMSSQDMIRLTSRYTVARMLERDDFKRRYAEGRSISIHEFLYPLVQGHDSVALRADVEIGGSDQLFNLLVGRHLQREGGQEPQIILTTPLLEGTDGHADEAGKIVGKKMSKSLGNYVGINEPPKEIFGKLMSITDDLMWRYYELLSDRSAEEITQLKSGHPMAAKEALGVEIATRYHGAEAAEEARRAWKAQFSKGKIPDDIAEFSLDVDAESGQLWIVLVLRQAKLAQSSSEATRLIKGGAVRVDGEQVKDRNQQLDPGSYILKVGKRRWAKVELKPAS